MMLLMVIMDILTRWSWLEQKQQLQQQRVHYISLHYYYNYYYKYKHYNKFKVFESCFFCGCEGVELTPRGSAIVQLFGTTRFQLREL